MEAPAWDSREVSRDKRGQALGFGGVVSQSQKIYEEHRVIKAHVLKTPEVLLETVWYPEPTRSEAYWGL